MSRRVPSLSVRVQCPEDVTFPPSAQMAAHARVAAMLRPLAAACGANADGKTLAGLLAWLEGDVERLRREARGS